MNKNIIIGAIFVLVGALLFGSIFELWSFDLFFDGWWTLFILIPSVVGLFQKQWISSILGIIIGVLLLLASNGTIEWSMVGRAFLPVVFIMVGLSIILKPKFKKVHGETDSSGQSTYIAFFSGVEQRLNGILSDKTLTTMFGGVDLDLRDVQLTHDVRLQCVCLFGGIDLIMPDNVTVKTTGAPIFGGIDNKYNGTGEHTVTVDYTCIFGGIDIK